MSGNTSRSWYERSENAASGGASTHFSKKSGWQTDTEFEDTASQHSVESSYSGRDSVQYPTVNERILTTFQKSVYTDVSFVINCGVKPKPTVRAHRSVLAVSSPVFEDMFSKQEAEGQGLIQINNTPLHAFNSVIEYLYTDEVHFERDHDKQVMEILSAAKAFQVAGLEARCISYLESSEVTESNVCSRLQLATANKLEQQKNMCMQFIQDNTSSVLRSSDFLSSDLSTVRNICKLPKLFLASEKELFEGVLEWVKAHPDSRSKSKRDIFDPLLHHIRFLSMTAQDFSRLVSSNTDLFTSEEALSIIVYLSKPEPHLKSALPAWCSKAANRCTTVLGAERVLPNRNPSSREKKVCIGLKPVKKSSLPYLMCELALRCTGGSQKIKALKIKFGSPVTQSSTIQELVVSVYAEPDYFSFKEHHTKIQNATECFVPFTQTLLARRGNIIHIRAEVLNANNYHFLQYDEENTFLEPSPFEYKLNSEPKGKQLFFISEIIYEELPPRRRGPVMYRSKRT